MLTTAKRFLAGRHHAPETPGRADRLLKNMHKVFSHDLPNQMMAVQGLLQLLSLEETDRMSPAGREYVRRLQNASHRASDLVRFLREMSRLNGYVPKPETIDFGVWERELQVELRRQFPEREFQFDWQWQGANLVADSRALLRGAAAVCAGLLARSGPTCRVFGTAERGPSTVELAFHLEEIGATQPGPTPAVSGANLDLVLAREWLAICQADLDVAPVSATKACFSILVPEQ